MNNPITIDYEGECIVVSLPSGHKEKLSPENAEMLLAALWVETKGEWSDWADGTLEADL